MVDSQLIKGVGLETPGNEVSRRDFFPRENLFGTFIPYREMAAWGQRLTEASPLTNDSPPNLRKWNVIDKLEMFII